MPLGEWGGVAITLPNLTIVAIVTVLAVWVLLEQTTFGRRLYAIGGNIEAAHLSGVAVRRLKLIAFSLTGGSAALAGIMYASRVASANPTQGSGLMLNAIAAVFLGMTMSEHNEPRIFATIVGVLILGVLDNGLTQMSVDSYVRRAARRRHHPARRRGEFYFSPTPLVAPVHGLTLWSSSGAFPHACARRRRDGEKVRSFVSAQMVADRAGVSRSAVSRTFTDGASVSAATRRKVLSAANDLGYHVNHLAAA